MAARKSGSIGSRSDVYWLDNSSKAVKPLNPKTSLPRALGLMHDGASTLYGVYMDGKRLHRYLLQNDSQGITLDNYNYHDVIYDSVRKGVWAVGKQRILFYSLHSNKKILIEKDVLNLFGIKKAEQITAESKYGYIILRDYDRLLCSALKMAG